jgi:hypothetical protein
MIGGRGDVLGPRREVIEQERGAGGRDPQDLLDAPVLQVLRHVHKIIRHKIMEEREECSLLSSS